MLGLFRLWLNAWHTMHAGDFLQASAGRLPLTNPRTSHHWWRLAGFPCTTLHAFAYHNTHNHYCKRLFTDRHIDSRSLLFATSRAAAVSHTRKHRTGATCTASQAVHKGDRRIRSQREPVLVISALHTIFWSFSSLQLILSWLIPNHSTATVKEQVTPKTSSDNVNKLQATLSEMNFPPIFINSYLADSHVSKDTRLQFQ